MPASAGPLVVHERTLHGAIDAHLGNLTHNRPWVVLERTEALEDMAEEWIAGGGANWLPGVDAGWIDRHLDRHRGDDHAMRAEAIADLLTWATGAGLV